MRPPPAVLDAAVDLFSAMAHPIRLTVLVNLGREGPKTVGELQELGNTEQSAMSHHLKLLRDRRLVVATRQGKQVLYALADRHIAHIVEDAMKQAAEEFPPPAAD